MMRDCRDIPVLLEFPEETGRAAAWGRLVFLNAAGTALETRVKLELREEAFLSFDAAGRNFKRLAVSVIRAARDEDGYWAAHARFVDVEVRADLARFLRSVISAS